MNHHALVLSFKLPKSLELPSCCLCVSILWVPSFMAVMAAVMVASHNDQNEYLFATTDLAQWLVCDKVTVYQYGNPAMSTIKASSASHMP